MSVPFDVAVQGVSYPSTSTSDFVVGWDDDRNLYEQTWNQQLALYTLAWTYYTGRVFDQTVPDDPETELYPLRINSIKTAVKLHSRLMWGTPATTSRKIVDIHVRPDRREFATSGRINTTEMERCEEIERFYNRVLRTNHAITMFREQGRLFHLLGGCWFKFRFDPNHVMGFTFNGVPAEYVYPVWNPLDYSELLRVYVRFPMDARIAAQLYGFNGRADGGGRVTYMEQWEGDRYKIMVGEQVARDMRLPDRPLMQGELGLVDPRTGQRRIPWVYIPRDRAGSFFGDSLAGDLFGLQNELNSREADNGDAVTAAAHPSWWGRDITRRRDDRGPLRPNSGEIFDAGNSDATGRQPHIDNLGTPELSPSVIAHPGVIRDHLDRQSSLSSVIFGEDEGSQRSALTLHARALPTAKAVEDYQEVWTYGMTEMFYISTLMALRLNKHGAEASWLDHEVELEYPPILPQDRQLLMQELVTRLQANGLSLMRFLELSPDIPDAQAEYDRIMADAMKKMQMEQRAADMANRAAGQADLATRKQSLEMSEEEHGADLRHSDEKHQQQMRQRQEKAAATKKKEPSDD